MAAESSLKRLISPSRAPSLRRHAELLEEQADRSPFPNRVRSLARAFRLRAAEIELGVSLDELQELREAERQRELDPIIVL